MVLSKTHHLCEGVIRREATETEVLVVNKNTRKKQRKKISKIFREKAKKVVEKCQK